MNIPKHIHVGGLRVKIAIVENLEDFGSFSLDDLAISLRKGNIKEMTDTSMTNDASEINWTLSSWTDPAIPITYKLKAAMMLIALPLVLGAFFVICPVLILMGRFYRANICFSQLGEDSNKQN